MECEGCCNRIGVPGNSHIGCKNPSLQVELLCWPGCGIFPISFDENIVKSCDHKDVPGEAAEDTPLMKLMRIMG